MDIGKFIKSYVVSAITLALTALSAYIADKYKVQVHIAVPLVVTPVLFGLMLLAKHWHLDALAMSLAPDDPPQDPATSQVPKAAALLLVAIALGFFLSGCKSLDAKLAKTFQDREAVLMLQLGGYLDADAKAGKKTADQVAAEKAGIAAHLIAVQQDLTKVPAEEETGLMAELLAYVQSDPARDADSKADKGDSIQQHLRLFNDLLK